MSWNRIDLIIARSAPVWNIKLLEQLRREESKWELVLIKERLK